MKKLNALLKVCALMFFAVLVVSGCKKDNPDAMYTPEREAGLIKDWVAANAANDVKTTASGINYYISKVGTGATVTTGKTVTVKYTAMFMDGSVFDSSDSFTYAHKGASSGLISGWIEGIQLMSKGGKNTFVFPSAKAYGSARYDVIPPYSPLIFVIEVVDIK
jgi:FKBP-type peptidyl-prolyl cis-trans isomerase